MNIVKRVFSLLVINSLRLRLGVLMSFGIVALVCTLSIFYYGMLKTNLQKTHESFFTTHVAVIKRLVNKSPTLFNEAIKQELVLEPQVNQQSYYVVIENERTEQWVATPHIQEMLGVSPLALFDQHRMVSSPVKLKKKRYEVFNTRIQQGKESYRLSLAYNVTHDENILKKFRTNILVISVIGVLLAIAIMNALIWVGLSPLARVVSHVRKMHPESLETITMVRLPQELQALVDALNNLMCRVKKSYHSVSDFSSNIAHELRTPINNLLTSSELLLKSPDIEFPVKELIASNVEEYQRLSRIIERLLFLSRLHSSRSQITRENFSLNNAIQKIKELHEAVAEDKQMTLHIQASGDIQADYVLFSHALSNVMTNAICYSDEGGCVEVMTTITNDTVAITIADNGPGVSDEQLPRLTERFYRTEMHRATSSGGSGLGLAIVKSIMDAHGGHVHITRNEPRGLRVTLVFPRGD